MFLSALIFMSLRKIHAHLALHLCELPSSLGLHRLRELRVSRTRKYFLTFVFELENKVMDVSCGRLQETK
jgi:hypothetical protein